MAALTGFWSWFIGLAWWQYALLVYVCAGVIQFVTFSDAIRTMLNTYTFEVPEEVRAYWMRSRAELRAIPGPVVVVLQVVLSVLWPVSVALFLHERRSQR